MHCMKEPFYDFSFASGRMRKGDQSKRKAMNEEVVGLSPSFV